MRYIFAGRGRSFSFLIQKAVRFSRRSGFAFLEFVRPRYSATTADLRTSRSFLRKAETELLIRKALKLLQKDGEWKVRYVQFSVLPDGHLLMCFKSMEVSGFTLPIKEPQSCSPSCFSCLVLPMVISACKFDLISRTNHL